jgi:hypothetical protein
MVYFYFFCVCCHLGSACYGIALHPTLDVLMTCGRDAVVRVSSNQRGWEMLPLLHHHHLLGGAGCRLLCWGLA